MADIGKFKKPHNAVKLLEFVSDFSEASEVSLGQWRGVGLGGASKLRDGWAKQAETWWIDRGYMQERPRQGQRWDDS